MVSKFLGAGSACEYQALIDWQRREIQRAKRRLDCAQRTMIALQDAYDEWERLRRENERNRPDE